MDILGIRWNGEAVKANNMESNMKTRNNKILLPLAGIFLLLTAFITRVVFADSEKDQKEQISAIHPTFSLLDENGENVLVSNAPVSTINTCGQCHDTEFITTHSYHSDLGLSGLTPVQGSWNAGSGLFGRWDPLAYRYLTQAGDERLDLSTAGWIMLYGDRVVGGGPAMNSRQGTSLATLPPNARNPETSFLDPETGDIRAWNWQESGVIEMNCFLCHTEKPNNQARLDAVRAGNFDLVNTSTLFGSGIVDKTATGFAWNVNAFDDNYELKPEFVKIQDPNNDNCAACHGVVHTEVDIPLVLSGCTWETGTTGQIITPQRISDSGMNISDKEVQTRAWDVHAERGLNCTDCHFALNNPSHTTQPASDSPGNLFYDPRTLEIGEYLEKPDHNFARGQSSQYNTAPELKGSMRRCESCHDAEKDHDNWLPYTSTHLRKVACESCHIPKLYAPAIQTYDWTVLNVNSLPASVCRGIDRSTPLTLTASTKLIPPTVTNLVTGYQPVLLNRTNLDGSQMIAPYNLISSFYWVYTDVNGNQRPVRLIDLQAAFFMDGSYKPEIVTAFDGNSDRTLNTQELVLDTPAKEAAVRLQLLALGLNDVHIEGRIEPYSINHDVTVGDWALNDCQVCHTDRSRLVQPFKLADYAPAGVLPDLVGGTNVSNSGKVIKTEDGALYYQPEPAAEGLYVFGFSRLGWVDGLGAVFFGLTLVAASVHGTLRFFALRRKSGFAKQTERAYIYKSYERFWHWLQTITIVLLLVTGLIIHRPDVFGMFSFQSVVIVHNVLATILAANALLSLFYHMTTGLVHQYIPRPYGFFDQAILQAKYYLSGIFKGQPHPFLKTPENKLNPLQQITYFGILVVLLPLQGITGILIWGVQRWPEIAGWFGGLQVLAPAHTLFAWVFAAFIVGHVYLTTTGTSPLESIRSMVIGYEQVEIHD